MHVMTVLWIAVKRSVGANKKINVLVHCSQDILYRDILCVPTYLLAVIPPQREAETKAKVQEKRCTKRLAVGCMSVLQ